MDTFDYQRSSVPAKLPSQRVLASTVQRFDGDSHDQVPSPISIKAVLRASRRYWWLILALWTVGTAGIGAAVYLKVRPLYRANSWLKVNPTVIDLYGGGRGGEDPYMATHVALIKSPTVLAAASHDSRVALLPRIQMAGDAIQELGRVIQVGVQAGTNIIEVAMVSESAEEAATLVNAVVDAFIVANRDWSSGSNEAQLTRLNTYMTDLDKEIKQKEADLRTKVSSVEHLTAIAPIEPDAANNGNGKNEKSAPGSVNWTVDAYRQMLANSTATKLQLLHAEAALADARRTAQEMSQEAGVLGDRSRSSAQLDFKLRNDPQLIDLLSQCRELAMSADKIKADTRNSGDPAERNTRDKLAKVRLRHKLLRDQKKQQYQSELETNPGQGSPEAEVAHATAEVNKLLSMKTTLDEELSKLKLQSTKQQGDELDIRFLQEDRAARKDMWNIVHRKHEQLMFDSVAEERIRLLNPARPEGRAAADKRIQYMAMAPVGVLGAVLGLVILLEIRSGRVADTEVLAARMRHEVFSIAPLPNIRPGLIGDTDKAGQRLARFVQSIDHLRVALCEGGTNGEGRCVMITSATGGEGKTTLAAHLAARCANAGTATLLIDADLRRASLGRLLDVPAGPGLGDVLAGLVELDPSLLHLQPGGFHFLSAGTPGIDPTRVLKSNRLAELIGQLRQMYDLVIIDTPPVLPVADALIMGRWADGAVMAARYDASRLPLVERANRQIIAAGIPVLGVVVNGVKTQDQAYGSYAYSYSYPGRQESVTNDSDVS